MKTTPNLKKTKAFMVFVVLVAIAALGIWKGNAFIHRNDIKVVQDATAFSQMNYEFAQGIFADYGFTDIQYDVDIPVRCDRRDDIISVGVIYGWPQLTRIGCDHSTNALQCLPEVLNDLIPRTCCQY